MRRAKRRTAEKTICRHGGSLLRRENMLKRIAPLKKYIACARVSARPIFEFVPANVHASVVVMVFAFEDDYSFGIIQSSAHIEWYRAKCSTMKADPRYTTSSVWDTFPWPQKPTKKQVEAVAHAARNCARRAPRR